MATVIVDLEKQGITYQQSCHGVIEKAAFLLVAANPALSSPADPSVAGEV